MICDGKRRNGIEGLCRFGWVAGAASRKRADKVDCLRAFHELGALFTLN
jgi:hypothetical protein